MLAVYTPAHRQHHPLIELYDGQPSPVPEVPDRLEAIVQTLRSMPAISWATTRQFDDAVALGLHHPHYVDYLRRLSTGAPKSTDIPPSNFIHDTYAPVTDGTFAAARLATDTALTAAEAVLQGEPVAYALCRPPGHHAGDGFMGGYCYFNNAAAAAHYLSRHGRVAILDIDYHHGNGTQQLFYERADVLYVSVHADPTKNYPYTHGFASETGRVEGDGSTRNFPVPKNCGWAVYRRALVRAISEVKAFAPDYLVVSLGFDGYKDDPIAGFGLSVAHFGMIAEQIRMIDTPTLLVQEGGYCVEKLGELAGEFCGRFIGK